MEHVQFYRLLRRKADLCASGIDVLAYVLQNEFGSGACRMAQWVEHLLHRCESLSSNPKTHITTIAAMHVCNPSAHLRGRQVTELTGGKRTYGVWEAPVASLPWPRAHCATCLFTLRYCTSYLISRVSIFSPENGGHNKRPTSRSGSMG